MHFLEKIFLERYIVNVLGPDTIRDESIFIISFIQWNPTVLNCMLSAITRYAGTALLASRELLDLFFNG